MFLHHINNSWKIKDLLSFWKIVKIQTSLKSLKNEIVHDIIYHDLEDFTEHSNFNISNIYFVVTCMSNSSENMFIHTILFINRKRISAKINTNIRIKINEERIIKDETIKKYILF